MQSYVVSSLPGRARVRHPFLKTEEVREGVAAFLKGVDGVREVRQGKQSLLIFFGPKLTIDDICALLEKECPEFVSGEEQGTKEMRPSLLSCLGGARRLENRGMLAAFAATALLGFFGGSRAHVVVGSILSLVTLHHVWSRRKAL